MNYRFKTNGGQGSARNMAIALSQGKYIAFLDSDDAWEKEKLTQQITILEKYAEYDFCYTADIKRTIKKDKRVDQIVRVDQSQALSEKKLMGIPTSVPSSHVYRKEVFARCGGFDEDPLLKGLEDNDWSLRAHFLKGYYLDQALTIYVQHEGQITQNSVRQEKYEKALYKIISKNETLLRSFPNAYARRIAQVAHVQLHLKKVKEAKANLLTAQKLDPQNKTYRVLQFLSLFGCRIYLLAFWFRKTLTALNSRSD
jgi:glycosyltransferase involved in cell wall biosynthesis